MLYNFPNCVGFTLNPLQDGQALHTTPGDPGGATAYGVTQAELSSYLGRPATTADMEALTAISVQPIYQHDYWGPIEGDLLPVGVDLMVFDHGVDAGWFDSAKILQSVVRVTSDGWVGPQTMAAVNAAYSAAPPIAAAGISQAILIGKLAYAQELDYRADSGWAEFGNGWLARLDRRVQAALTMLFTPAPAPAS